MTKLKFKPRGMVQPDSVFHLCREIEGELYAIITARSDGKGAEHIIAIAGPFAGMEEAKAATASAWNCRAAIDNSI